MVWAPKRLARKLVYVLPLLAIFAPSTALAIDPSLYQALQEPFYEDVANATDCSYTADKSSGGGNYSHNQVRAFAATPITSTWNISDSTVQQWFLKQAGARATVTKYGLTSSNIGNISSAVKAAKVSPVFFYLWAVNEGGGAGGFINHFVSSHDTGNGVKDATADAEYMASQSKVMSSIPSWIDAGNPVDFVPQAVKNAGNADFKNMPSGSIGRLYIAAGAAAAWEIYYPDGLKKEVNKVQNYGSPLQQAMQNIQNMGGNPQQSGATLSTDSCTPGGIAGKGITKAVNWAVMIAKNDGYGYDQTTPGDGRASGWAKWKSDPNCTHQCGSFDCSSFIAAALTEAGYFSTNPEFSTFSEASSLSSAGFKKVASYPTSSADLQPGDILLNTQDHTAMYIGNNRVVQASQNENKGANGGQVGDQTGQEIWITQFYIFPKGGWDGVWRASS